MTDAPGKRKWRFNHLLVITIFCIRSISADFSSTTNRIDFIPTEGQSATSRLDGGQLGIGTLSPSANLHVQGGGIISEKLTIGSSMGSSTLHIEGSFAMGGLRRSLPTPLFRATLLSSSRRPVPISG